MRVRKALIAGLTAVLAGGCTSQTADYQPYGFGSLSVSYEHGPPHIGSCGFYREGKDYSLTFLDASGRYTTANMTVTENDHPLKDFEGAVLVDQNHGRIQVELYRVGSDGRRKALPINGSFRIDTRAERADYARDRVKFVLAGARGEIPVARKTVIAYWYRGTYLLADEEMEREATELFDAWETQAGLDRGFGQYRITDAQVLGATDPTTVIVAVMIDGSPRRIRVPSGKPLTWE